MLGATMLSLLLTLDCCAGDWEEIGSGEIRSCTITIYDEACNAITVEKMPSDLS